MGFTHTATVFTKIVKIFFNIVVMVLYRNGDVGYFMGGSYNQDPDIEGFTCGIYVGYLIYNIVSLCCNTINSEASNKSPIETIMNGVGAILWLINGGVLIQFWLRYSASNQFIIMHPQRMGIVMGVLTTINSVFFAVDSVLSYQSYASLKY